MQHSLVTVCWEQKKKKGTLKWAGACNPPKMYFAALCMLQGHATVKSGAHTGRILSK